MIIYWVVCLISIAITWVVTRIKTKSTSLGLAGNKKQGVTQGFRVLMGPGANMKDAINAVFGKVERKNTNTGWVAALICSLPLMLLSALRDGIGTDFVAYEGIYKMFIRTFFNHEYEWLFTVLNASLNRLGLSFRSFVALTALLYCLLIFKMILEESPVPGLSIFLLLGMTFYFQSFNIIRNMLACAFCLFSIRYIKDRRLVLFAVCMALAFGFHLSAVAFFPLFFIPQKKLSAGTYVICLGGVLLCAGALRTFLVDYIIRLGASFNNGYYMPYFVNLGKEGFGLVSFAINFCLFVWAYIFMDKDDRSGTLLLNIQFLALLISVMNGSFPLVNRLRFYYGLPAILLIPRVIGSKKMKSLGSGFAAINVIAIAGMFFGYCWFIEGILNESGCVPYQSIL